MRHQAWELSFKYWRPFKRPGVLARTFTRHSGERRNPGSKSMSDYGPFFPIPNERTDFLHTRPWRTVIKDYPKSLPFVWNLFIAVHLNIEIYLFRPRKAGFNL